MRTARRILLGLCVLLAGAGAALAGAFLFAQTPFGKAWIAREAGRLWSRPGFSVAIEGLAGTLPFQMNAKRIAIGDAMGTWLTISGVRFDLSARALLRGEGRIRLIAASEVMLARLPAGSGSRQAASWRFVLPHLPLALRLDRISVARLVLAAPVLGERLTATLDGSAAVARGVAQAALDLHRTDGMPGGLTLALALAHRRLSLHLAAQEPTGLLADRLFSRRDHLPLTLSLDGAGPIGNWEGRLEAAAGHAAQLSARLHLAAAAHTDLALAGTASLAGLLPAAIAPLLGERTGFRLSARLGARIAIERLLIEAACGRITGEGSFDPHGHDLAATLEASLPSLSPFRGIIGIPVAGRATVKATLGGTVSQTRLTAVLTARGLSYAGAGAKQVTAKLAMRLRGAGQKRRVELRAEGKILGIALATGGALPPGPVVWSLDARAAGRTCRILGRCPEPRPGGSASSEGGEGSVELNRLTVSGLGVELVGSGTSSAGGRHISARLSLKAADLGAFSSLFGQPIGGSLLLEGRAASRPADGLFLALDGRASGLKTRIAAADALLGGRVEISGLAERGATGLVRLDRLRVAGSDAKLSASGELDPASRLRLSLAFAVPSLEPLGSAIAIPLAGRLSGRARIEGPKGRLAADGELTGIGLALAGKRLDRLRLGARVANLSQPVAAVKGGFRSGKLDGKLGFVVKPLSGGRIDVEKLHLAAPGSALEGRLEFALPGRVLEASVKGQLDDLKPWSPLVGFPLGGRLGGQAAFASGRSGELRLQLNGSRLGAGSWRVEELSLAARLSNLERAPSGEGRLSLRGLRVAGGEQAALSLSFATTQMGDFGLSGAVDARRASLKLAGALRIAEGRQELRLRSVRGSFEGEAVSLGGPLSLSRRGADFAFSNLDLRWGPGRVTGSGAVKGNLLSLRLKGSALPLAPLARLAGYPALEGSASLDAALGGNLAAPRGHAQLRLSALRVALSQGERLPPLGLRLDGDWDGRRTDFRGELAGRGADRIGFRGSLPLRLARAPFSFSLPRDGPLSLRVEGAGDLAHFDALLPFAEDRLSGRYTLDLAASGTIAQPLASGRLTIAGARYANFASGAVASDLDAELVGDRNRLRLDRLSATDGEKGRIEAQGAILFGGGAPRAELSARLRDFRILARDDATARASGSVRIEGPLAAPTITAELVSDRAELRLPKRLPPSIVRLNVVVIDSKTRTGRPPEKIPSPAMPARLDLRVTLPGRVFVRGRGLDSEWRGRLVITDTTAEPRIAGTLNVVGGTFALLGKTFRLEEGTIRFAGAKRPDPMLDVLAIASTADITAEVRIGGTLLAPHISLSSTPSLPQDEILSRLLFNQGLGQITPAQGLELAQAAAALTGSGPDLLDSLRGKLGLDWLRFGSQGAATPGSILNPAAARPSGAAATGVSAGKYIGNGITVGVSQGLSPPTSQVTVGVQLRPHISVQTDVGSHGGTGVGLYYKYDY